MDVGICGLAHAVLVVSGARDEKLLAFTKGGHGGHTALIVSAERGSSGNFDSVENLLGLGHLEAFAQMPSDGVAKHDHRDAKAFREVEGSDGQIVHLLDRPRCQGDDLYAPVGSPFRLHHVSAGRTAGLARARSGPLDIHHHARCFGHARITYVLHHQTEPRARRGRHALDASPGGANHSGHASDLILHLDEHATGLRQALGHVHHYLRGGSDGIAGIEPTARRDGAFCTGLITHHVVGPWFQAAGHGGPPAAGLNRPFTSCCGRDGWRSLTSFLDGNP